MTQNQLLSAPIARTLWRLSLPNLFGIVTIMTFNLVDTYFISQLGAEPLTAFSLTFPVTLLLSSLMAGLGTAVTSQLGHYLGGKKRRQGQAYLHDVLGFTLLLTCISAVIVYSLQDHLFIWLGANHNALLLIKDYIFWWLLGSPMLGFMLIANQGLRADGDTRSAAKIMSCAALINLILDPMLIFGFGIIPAMGIAGAALATCIAWLLASLFCLYLLIRKTQLLQRFPWQLARFTRHWRQLTHIAKPAILMNILNPLSNALLMALMARLDYAAVAALGAGMRIESFALMGVFALSSSLTVFIAQNLGAQQYQRAHQGLMLGLHAVLVLQLMLYLPLFYFREPISLLFSQTAEISAYISFYIAVIGIAYGPLAVVILVANSLNAYQQPMMSLAVNVARLLGVLLPLSLVGGYVAGAHGVLIALATSHLLVGGGCYLLALRLATHSTLMNNNRSEANLI